MLGHCLKTAKYTNVYCVAVLYDIIKYHPLFSRSHDGYEVNADGLCVPTNPKYADQRNVFDDLGQGVLNNAFKGTK